MGENNIRALKIGTRLKFKGFEWVVLDNGIDTCDGVMILMTSVWNNRLYQFNDAHRNNYGIASLREKLSRELPPILGSENLLFYAVDLVDYATNGYYQTVYDKVFILSYGEYQKYKKNIPKFPTQTWTRTPWLTSRRDSSVCTIGEDRTEVRSDSWVTAGVVPACVLDLRKIKVNYQIPEIMEITNCLE